MFRQLLHTRCRPGLRLSRNYEGTAAQLAVLHMPWWERGIEQTKKMVISYDNLITRLWLSGAILPYARGGFASKDDNDDDDNVVSSSHIDTMIDEHGLPPVPHQYWIDRLGFQQDDPVTDFRSGGVLSLAMLVHIIESCPLVHSRFVPKSPSDDPTTSHIHINKNDDDDNNDSRNNNNIMSLEEIIHDDASVLPFGITCINITDMLAKFLLFSKAVDKMDALLSAKPFWKMFIDPNALLILQEVSLDLLCDVCVEIGRERRVQKLVELDKKNNNVGEHQQQQRGMPGVRDGKVTVFDFSEIMERTEKRVGEEILGAGPQNVDGLRAVAHRVKSKYLMRIQLKEKHGIPKSALSLSKQHLKPMPSIQTMPMPTKESMMNVTNSVIGGVGGFVSMLKDPLLSKQRGGGGDSRVDLSNKGTSATATVPIATEVLDFTFATMDGKETNISSENVSPGTVEVHLDGTTDVNGTLSMGDELDKLSSELEDLSTFDLLDGDDDFDMSTLEAMDDKVDPFAAFVIDKDNLLS